MLVIVIYLFSCVIVVAYCNFVCCCVVVEVAVFTYIFSLDIYAT